MLIDFIGAKIYLQRFEKIRPEVVSLDCKFYDSITYPENLGFGFEPPFQKTRIGTEID